MNFSKIKKYKIVISLALIILVCAGSLFVFSVYSQPEELQKPPQQDLQPTPAITTPIQPATFALPILSSTQDPGSQCSLLDAGPHIPVPIDTSIPVRDPMPGIRYSLGEGDSGKTIEIGKGDVFEITLRWAPSVAWDWNIPVSGCGLEMVNDGYYDTGTDYWNQSGHYRARYRAVRSGTSFIDGIFGVPPGGTAHEWNPKFNLTVIVK